MKVKAVKTIATCITQGKEYEVIKESKDLIILGDDGYAVGLSRENFETEHGYKGMCCCNCKFQIQVNKHPKNIGEAKGSISELFGYVCLTTFEDGSGTPTFSNGQHGMCEYWTSKEQELINK